MSIPELRRVSASRKQKKSGPAQKRGHSRVSRGMHIYLITNKVNGKQYVGKTTRKDPAPRWREHKKDSRKGCVNVISRAIYKHGIENFIFQVIETVDDPVVLAERESFYINQYNTLSPHGYNIVMHQPHFVLTPEARQRRSICNQGVPKSKTKTSSYLGVYRKGFRWVMEIAKDRQTYSMRLDTEKAAARIYDMMALRLYGDMARLNFPPDYPFDEIEETYQRVIAAKYSSHYRGVSHIRTVGYWRATVELSGGSKKTWVKRCSTEVEAARAYDKAMIHLNQADATRLNFPDEYDSYVSEDLALFCHRPAKSTKYEGVHKYPSGRYRAKIKVGGKTYHFGYFDTEELAYTALQAGLKELKL